MGGTKFFLHGGVTGFDWGETAPSWGRGIVPPMLGWPGEVNEGKIVGVMIVDLSTAFDTVISCQVGIIWT